MEKEDVIHIYNGILFSHKNKIMPSAATRMDLETVILSEVRKTYHDDITYMWNQKKGGYK